MPNSCFRGFVFAVLRCSRDVVHQVAYQLTVTRRGKIPETRDHPPNEWESSNPRLNGQKRSKISAIAIDTMRAEIWPGCILVNGVKALPRACRPREALKEFMILPDFSRCQGPTIGRVSGRLLYPSPR
jgi:hypothetical protein